MVFHTNCALAAAEVWEQLSRMDLPKLWIPKRENIHALEALPTLGAGKLDFCRLKSLLYYSSVESFPLRNGFAGCGAGRQACNAGGPAGRTAGVARTTARSTVLVAARG